MNRFLQLRECRQHFSQNWTNTCAGLALSEDLGKGNAAAAAGKKGPTSSTVSAPINDNLELFPPFSKGSGVVAVTREPQLMAAVKTHTQLCQCVH